jgi:hypothetical protein
MKTAKLKQEAMDDRELDRVLRRAKIPARSAAYWNRLQRLVVERIRNIPRKQFLN